MARGRLVFPLGFERFARPLMDMQRGSTRSLNSFRTLSIGSFLSAVAVHSYGSSYALSLQQVLSGSGSAVVLASRSSSARPVSQLPLPKRALDESGAIHSWRCGAVGHQATDVNIILAKIHRRQTREPLILVVCCPRQENTPRGYMSPAPVPPYFSILLPSSSRVA